jgi:hypothetical protein
MFIDRQVVSRKYTTFRLNEQIGSKIKIITVIISYNIFKTIFCFDML